MSTRRQFLARALRAPAVIAVGSAVPGFLLHAAERQNAERGATVDERILVVVQLTGGNDGLNTVVPFTSDVYRRARRTLAIPAADVLPIDRELGFHPSLRGFADLLEQNRLAIVQGVGYPDPNRSHFESMDIWHTCRRKDAARKTGWLGRCLDAQTSTTRGDVPALHLGNEKQPLALASESLAVPTVRTIEQFQLRTSEDVSRAVVEKMAAADRGGADDLLGFVQSSTTSALTVSERFSLAAKQVRPDESYPRSELGQKLGTVARLIASGLRTRVYYTELDGFDTHARQAASHASLLRQLGDSVAAFLKDMHSQGQGQRVLVMCFSEFGRRLAENASEGTDHGAAAPMFLAGGAVRAGLIGRHPSLDDLDHGDLRHHTDFRQVYAAVLERWLGCDSERVLGGKFAPVDVVAMT